MKIRMKSLKAVMSLLRGLAASGSLDSGQLEALREEIARLDHAMRVRDQKAIRAATDRVARVLLREVHWR